MQDLGDSADSRRAADGVLGSPGVSTIGGPLFTD